MEKKVFFLLKLKTKIKARWIEHIIKTQIGVNWAIVHFEKRVILAEYDSKLITPQYMRMLVRSLGCDLVFDDKEVKNKENQLGNLLILKKRSIVLLFIFIISLVGFICPFYNWLLFIFSISELMLYFSLFINVFNERYNRLMWNIDRVGLLLSLLSWSAGVASMFILAMNVMVSVYFVISIIVVQLLLFHRWFKEKRIAERELL